MLTLRHSPSSPFVRKIRIGASVLGLDGEIRIEPADTMNPADSVRQQNPLGKIPALVLEDGTVLFDSRVILEYLDHRAGGGRIIPTEASARFSALRLQALADGIMDASVCWFTRDAGGRPSGMNRNGSISRLARSRALSRRSKPLRRRSVSRRMSARSRLPVRSAIATSVFPAPGVRIIRAWSPGSMSLPAACRPSPRPSRRAELRSPTHGKHAARSQEKKAPDRRSGARSHAAALAIRTGY